MTAVNDDIAAIEKALPIITPEDRARYTEATQPARLRRVLDVMEQMASALEWVTNATADEACDRNGRMLNMPEALKQVSAALAAYRGNE